MVDHILWRARPRSISRFPAGAQRLAPIFSYASVVQKSLILQAGSVLRRAI